MDLYSIDEVRTDIATFEKLEVCCLPDVYNNLKFIKLYSEVSNKPTPDTKSDSELETRVTKFLNNIEHVLPTCDVLPGDEHPFYIYGYHYTRFAPITDIVLVFVATAETKEEATEWFKSEEFKTKYSHMCIVSTETEEIMHFSLTKH
jgi:hypothetical protein